MEFVTLESRSEKAVLVPEAGSQCASYRVGALDLIVGPATSDAWRRHPFRSGIPILFPWPGRIANARCTCAGRELQFPVNEVIRGHAIHGLTWKYPFRVTRRGSDSLTTELDSSLHPDLERLWPWRFVFALDYELGDGLRIKATVRNCSESNMPFGLGAHPYFPAPFSSRGKRDAMRVHVPAMRAQWPLDSKMIPTGPPSAPVGKNDLHSERAVGGNAYDDVFQLELSREPAAALARLIDPVEMRVIEVRADAPFGECVVYAPPDREVVALEPYTCAPDAFNLTARGIASGARELRPGETFAGGFEIRLSAL